MLLKFVSSSMRHRLGLYVPMLITIVISLALLGSAEIVGGSFKQVVNREMGKYGANVILIPDGNTQVNEGVPVQVKNAKVGEAEVSLATANVAELLKMNPAWIVRGEGNVLVGKSVAEQIGLAKESVVEIEGIKGRVALLESGTEFDSYIMVNGEVESPSMILLKTDTPEQYKGKNAIVLEEMVKSKYGFLESIKKLMLYVAIISALTSMAVVVNLARIDAGERKREFGILSALGALPRTIAKFVLTEFLVLSSASGLFGLVLSWSLSWAVLAFTVSASPTLSLNILWYVLATSFIAFSLASLIYLVEFRRHNVVQELRGE